MAPVHVAGQILPAHHSPRHDWLSSFGIFHSMDAPGSLELHFIVFFAILMRR